ncbi:hypothetical protein D9O40_20240 [Clostridium autoethanogenum]|uniref:Resolvase/invertase-type recombinase catalytic domain-containing protein n=1 Tax=Clostridium autoethanogenum TaxID=84023 RepID=A0A3M0S3R1_9CLOT|nr:hypothetical protein D9O40_20240 [Clostridium autoethanogenum]
MKILFTIFADISQFERDLIIQRTKEGLVSARARDRKGGRPFKDEKDVALSKVIESDENLRKIAIDVACNSRLCDYHTKNVNKLKENNLLRTK